MNVVTREVFLLLSVVGKLYGSVDQKLGLELSVQ